MNEEERLWEEDNFSNAYRNWLVSIADGWEYERLFDIMYETVFTWIIPRDEDRARCGVSLRLRFADEAALDIPEGFLALPCSFLEMLVALAVDLEEDILYNPAIGNRTEQCFWTMLTNMGVGHCDDDWMFTMGEEAFRYVSDCIDTVMGRSYSKDGTGGLFPLKKPGSDQRETDLWYQANAYLIEQYEE